MELLFLYIYNYIGTVFFTFFILWMSIRGTDENITDDDVFAILILSLALWLGPIFIGLYEVLHILRKKINKRNKNA